MENEIKLLRNNDKRKDSDLDKIIEFYRFLTGEEMPNGIHMTRGHKPKMSEKKAFSIIWYLQEHLSIFPDHIERCNICGNLFDSYASGIYWESKRKFYCNCCDHLVPDNYDNSKRR